MKDYISMKANNKVKRNVVVNLTWMMKKFLEGDQDVNKESKKLKKRKKSSNLTSFSSIRRLAVFKSL